MDFVLIVVVFVVFFAGMVLAFQGLVGRDINPEGQPFAMPIDLDHPAVEHQSERHPVRLVLIGVGLMMVAVVVGLAAL